MRSCLRKAIGLGLALTPVVLVAATGWANHTLRKDLTDLLGPTAWGMYFVLPIPFLVVGVIGLLLYRASRAARPRPEERPPQTGADPEDTRS